MRATAIKLLTRGDAFADDARGDLHPSANDGCVVLSVVWSYSISNAAMFVKLELRHTAYYHKWHNSVLLLPASQ